MSAISGMRVSLPERGELTPEQAEAWERIASGPRGKVEGPLAVWLHSPQLADKAQLLGEFARYHTLFEPRLSELAILVTARYWTSHFEWAIHAPIAEKSGVGAAIIESIRVDEPPAFEAEDEAAVHDFVRVLLNTGKISDDVLLRVRKLFGDKGAVELSAIVGYYSTCAFAIALAEPVLPDGSRECLPPKS